MEQTSDESASNASGQEFGLCDDNLQRYSRSTLYSLRNTAKSSQRPKCFYNLQSLTCWKFTSAQHNKSSYDSLNVRPKLHAGERTAVDLPSENQTQSGLSNKRSLRSRERQIRFQLKRGGNNSEDESTTTSHSHQNNQTPLTPKQQIDQRSISSAHLLPAFAKRRLGMPAGGEYSSASHSGSDTRPETPSSNKYDHETRMRSSIHDSKQDYGHKGGYSPHHKAKDLEDNERPNSSNDYNNGNAIVKIGPTQDRRIGSGRFLTRDLTRDANWDYRGHDRDKTSTALEKDNSPSNHHNNHSRNSMGGGRYSDRGGGGGSDRIGGGSYVERRPYDRRNIGEEHNRDKDDNSHESGSSVNKYNSHNSNHNNTRYNHGLQKSTNGRQRRGGHSFHDRNEEPEWFSEGPTSQLDTIELRGFDEYDEQTNCEINDSRSDQESKRKMSESSSTRSSGSVAYASEQQQADQNKVTPSVFENNSSGGDYNNAEESNRTEQGPKYGALSSILDIKEHKLNDDNSNNNDDDDDNEDSHDDSTKKHHPETEFNFDEYLTLDPLDTTLMQNDDNIPIASSAIKSSRFTRWFGNKSNSEESGNKSTSQFNSNFENAKQEDDNSTTNKTLMDFLQGNKIPQNFVNNNRPQVPSITSVEELEARMRKIETPSQNDKRPLDNNLTVTVDSFLNGGQSGESGTPQPHPPPPPTQDMEAFKKLLRQLGTSNQQNNFMENVQVNMLPPPPPPQTQSVPTFAIANFVQPPEDGNPNFLHMQKNPEELSKLMHQHQMFQQQGNQQNLLYPIKLMPPQPRHILINKPPTVVFPPNVPNMFIDPTQKRNEVQNLMQAIARGEISLRFLEQELHNPHSSAQSKEIIATVLRETAQKAGNPHMNAAGSIHAPSPVPMGPGVTQQAPGFLHLNDMLMPGMQLMGDGEGFSPQPPPHGPMPNVDIQNNGEVLLGNDGGLIKSQFDEQQQQIDNSKKKQQQQQLGGMSGIQQQQQQQPVRQSPSILSIQQRQNNSPTPLAFTPTSVLRKMTAEKDLNVQQQQQQQNSGVQTPNKTPAALPNFTSMPVQLVQQQQQQHQQQQLQLQTSAGVVATQPRMILGGNNVSQHLLQQQQQNAAQTQISAQSQQNMAALRNAQQQQQQQQLKWQTAAPVINANLHGNKPLGRPILKGPVQNVTQANQLPPLPPHQLNHMPYAQKIDFQQIQLQQQQRLKNNQTPQHMLNPQLFPQLQSPPPPHNPPQQSPNNAVLTQLQQQQQFLHQQQMNMQRQQQQQQQQQQQLNVHHNPIMNSTNNAQSNSHGSIMNQRERGTLSPTSNQLAQWFSPELLAQATAGKLPLLNVNQALSLEEFERSIQQHSSAVVHN